jgi:hypothetical protein
MTVITEGHIASIKPQLVGKYTISEDREHWICENNKSMIARHLGEAIQCTVSLWLYILDQKATAKPEDVVLQRVCSEPKCVRPLHRLLISKPWTSFQRESDWVFLAFVLKEHSIENNGCLIWTGHTDNVGLPIYLPWRAYHLSYFLKHRVTSIPRGMIVTRSCGEKLCVFSEHLQLTPKPPLPGIIPTSEFCEKAKAFIIRKKTESEEGHWVTRHTVSETHPYPASTFQHRNWLLHRLSWISFNGRLPPDGEIIRHKCTLKRCVNPEHLETGTHVENAEDRVRDGTQRFGASNGTAIIDDDQARAIKRSKGEGTQYERAARFGVKRSMIRSIDVKASWKHI